MIADLILLAIFAALDSGKSASKSLIGLNGTAEYYCDEHYNQLTALMDMILGG